MKLNPSITVGKILCQGERILAALERAMHDKPAVGSRPSAVKAFLSDGRVNETLPTAHCPPPTPYACMLAALALTAGFLILSDSGWAQNSFKAQIPMAITSCGQSPDAYAVSLLCKRAKLEHTYNNVLKTEGLKEVNTLVVVMGGSAKGLGEAGIDEKAELERVAALLAKAKEWRIKVLAVHVGGQSRRGPLSDKFITPVISRADYVIVTEDGNKDGLFTRAAKDRNIALAVVKQLAEVGKELKALF